MLPFHQCLQTTNIAIIICSVPHTSIFSFWKRMADVEIFNQSCIIFCGTQQTANSRSWDMQLWNMNSKENTNQMWEKLTKDRLSNYISLWSGVFLACPELSVIGQCTIISLALSNHCVQSFLIFRVKSI